jgi:hypothetical protein
MRLGMTLASWLRKGAGLRTVLGPPAAGRLGWPRVYGESRVELARPAGLRRGWTIGNFLLYGERVWKRQARPTIS